MKNSKRKSLQDKLRVNVQLGLAYVDDVLFLPYLGSSLF